MHVQLEQLNTITSTAKILRTLL